MAAATSTKQQQQPKMVEKKLMDEKIAKVREVVKNISTNDIVLALHNFELDVERTIHAFCEGLFLWTFVGLESFLHKLNRRFRNRARRLGEDVDCEEAEPQEEAEGSSEWRWWRSSHREFD
jgi:hypothetical protein